MTSALSYAVWALLGLALLGVWFRSYAAGSSVARPGVLLGAPGHGPLPPHRAGPGLGLDGLAPVRPLTGTAGAGRRSSGDGCAVRHPDCNRTSPHMTQRRRNLCRMGDNEADTEQASDEEDATLPDLNPWRQVGWIFRDGDCVAIERHGAELDRKPRVLAD